MKDDKSKCTKNKNYTYLLSCIKPQRFNPTEIAFEVPKADKRNK